MIVLKAASALGIKIPASILPHADKVIECPIMVDTGRCHWPRFRPTAEFHDRNKNPAEAGGVRVLMCFARVAISSGVGLAPASFDELE
ncbi:MAG: hypothetical protein OEQ18_10425 [Gammaproteobacteria bacterium]|nr:hypothetical protein [Gammaproteobacteria bacterium]